MVARLHTDQDLREENGVIYDARVHPIDGLIRTACADIPEEQREAFLRMSVEQRMKWVDQTRRFIIAARMAKRRKPTAEEI
jgi:hypothetical protein